MQGISGKLKQLLLWFPAFGQWLGQLRAFPLLLFTAAVILISVTVAIWWRSEPAFRLTGLVLQLVGIATVAWNIRDTQERFGEPSTFGFIQWLHQFPQLKPRPAILAAAAVTLGEATLSARADIWSNINPDDYIELRLEAVEKILIRVKEKLQEFEQETGRNLALQSEALEKEKQARADDDEKIRRRLSEFAVGGLHISAAGIVCLLVGLIMSTASVELANFFAVEAPLRMHINDYDFP
jgi:hypothetical protein